MNRDDGPLFGGRAWLPALLIVPMFLGFAFLGVQGGTVIGTLTLAAVVVWAIRANPEGPIEIAAPGEGVRGGVLVVLLAPIDDPPVAGVLAAITDPSRREAGEPLLLAPTRIGRLDRFFGDIEAARFESQRVLAVSVATLAAAGIEVEGRVGDDDVVLAAEDTLRTYAATEVVVFAPGEDDDGAIAKLERRLGIPLRRID
ncbi:MAG: hypothetical protein KDB58_05870 [Solirubrobacterales bacterium]|nr:hypothetical protein [Solirubrobacterales bacterium]MCB8971523.1 hypothetical protein [Thermoleophilales bacterium]